VICSRCGTENRPDRRFCRSCGEALAVACPTCGAANEPGDRFCGSCGSALPADGAAPNLGAPATPSGSSGPSAPSQPTDGSGDGATSTERNATERRLVSVLFVDLVGFTSLAADRDAEAVRELLSRYFDLAREVIERYGGVVEKFIGDAVMAVWGSPTAHEDDAERAVRAALDLVDAVGGMTLGATGERLTARAGVLTGEAAVAIGARGEGMVAGDLVNTASRLQSVAPPGRVLVGEATVRASESSIAYEPAGEQVLKGKSSPVPAWLAVRVVAGRLGSGRSARTEPPFVGRDDELRLLKELFHATAREQRARLVSITGIAGIGKSRLAWELEKYLDGLVEPVYWHQGRSPAYGEGLAFWALGEMIRGRAAIAESDDASTAREKLRASVATYVPDAEERDWIERRLAVLLGLEPAVPGGAEELFAAWRTLFERIAERGTTVLVFEDVHWADAALLEFVEQLVARVRNRPLLVVTLARPELLERRPTWGAGQRSFTSLELGPLAAADMDQLLVGLVPGIPPGAIRAIRDRAEGIPLYAVETVRMLLDQGRLVETDGRYRLAGELGTLAIPDSLSGLLGARLDGLPEEERALLGHAAVLGQSFTVAALVAIGGLDEPAAHDLLGRLERREVVALDTDPRSPERGQYRFVQGVLREVAHGRLSKRERLQRHLAAARYFEQQEDDELAGVVASHYLDAHRASSDGPEAAELGDRARRALVAAAERARELHAHGRAIAYLEDAAELANDQVERRSLLERAADAALDGQAAAEALAYAQRVLDLVRAEDPVDREALARAEWRVGRSLVYLGRPAAAVEVLDAASREFGGAEATRGGVLVGSELGRAHLMAGDAEAARPVLDRVLPMAEALGDRAVIAELLISKGWAVAATGGTQEAIALLRGAFVLAERHAPPPTRFRGAMNLTANLNVEDPVGALTVAHEQMLVARRLGYTAWAQSLAGNAADPALWTGRWDLVEEIAREAEHDEVSGVFRHEADHSLAFVRAFQDRVAEADAIIAATRAATGAESEDPQTRASLEWTDAFVSLVGHLRRPANLDEALRTIASSFPNARLEAALLVYRAAVWLGLGEPDGEHLAALRAPGYAGRWPEAVRSEALALAAALVGDEDEASARFDDAIGVFRELGLATHLGLALVDRVVGLPTAAGRAEAEAEARTVLDRLGARGLLARLDELLAARDVPGRATDRGARVTASATG